MDFEVSPLPGADFGAVFRFPLDTDTRSAVAALEAEPAILSDALDRSGGLLLFPGLHAIVREPELLVRLSRLFGPEVENYRRTLSEAHMIHPLGRRDLRARQPSPEQSPAAGAAGPAAKRGRRAAGAVSPSKGLAHGSELPSAAA